MTEAAKEYAAALFLLAQEGGKQTAFADGLTLIKEQLDENNYIAGYELDVDALIADEMVLQWPMKILCKEDCKGICKVCGTNLNKSTCDCDQTVPDPRMAVFSDIFNQFKEV